MQKEPELDPEIHEDDTVVSVWKRRFLLGFLILLVVAVAAPSFAGCSGFFEQKKIAAQFTVGGVTTMLTEEDLGRFQSRYVASMRLLRRSPGLPEGDDGTKEALRVLAIEALAKDAGIEIPDSIVDAEIADLSQFQFGGKFDDNRYRQELSMYSNAGITNEVVRAMLRLDLRVNEYQRIALSVLQVLPGDVAYDRWKQRNLKLTVEYAVSTFAAQKAKIEGVEPTAEQLNAAMQMPRARELLAVPQKKVVEVAYLKVADLTPELVAAVRKFAEEAEILSEERKLEDEAFITFHGKRTSIFTKERWSAVASPDYPRLRREYEEKKAVWDKGDVATRGEEPVAPEDPAAKYPVSEDEQFKLWQDRATKEALAELLVNHIGRRAEDSGKPLAEVAAEYARFGVKVARNAEPLADADIVEKFPDPVARNSEFDIVVKSEFKGPGEGGVFKRQYHSAALPTTRQAENIEDRGYMVLCLEACDPPRVYTFEEKPEIARDFWKKYMVVENARTLAEEVRRKVEAAGPDVTKMVEALHAAAKESGLETGRLTRFNRQTEAPRAPAAAPGEVLSPEVEAAARRIKFRNLVQQQYPLLLSVPAGKLVDPVTPDDKTEAVYVMLVAEKHEPTPVEMRDIDLSSARQEVAREESKKFTDIFGYDAIAKRASIVRFEEKKPAAEESSGRR